MVRREQTSTKQTARAFVAMARQMIHYDKYEYEVARYWSPPNPGAVPPDRYSLTAMAR